MWKLLQISHQTYFIYCDLNDEQDVTFILYDLKTTWSQTLTFPHVKGNVKLLNKRFDFSDDNVREALLFGAIQCAFLDCDLEKDECLLKLKYRVKNCLLSYEWNLKKQNSIEFQQNFVQPLILGLLGCRQQVEILTDILHKKEVELKQFQIEGAVLTRKTVVTKPFDFEDFNRKFEDCNKIATDFSELAKYIKKHVLNEKVKVAEENFNSNVNKIEAEVKPRESSANVKMSPRMRKRKVNEVKMQHLEQHLKIRKQGLEYDSSQSQTQSSGNSQTIGESDVNNLKQIQRYQSKDIPSTRRSSRCTSIKKYFMSSEDDTDSHNEDDSRKHADNKIHLAEDCNIKSNRGQNKSNCNNKNAEERTSRSIKSLSLPDNSKKKSLNSSDNSNIFDFPNDNEDEKSDSIGVQKLKASKALKFSRSTRTASKVCESRTNISPALAHISEDNVLSPSVVIVNDISSQLDNIKKELETLEAMRLADLKQRTCKV